MIQSENYEALFLGFGDAFSMEKRFSLVGGIVDSCLRRIWYWVFLIEIWVSWLSYIMKRGKKVAVNHGRYGTPNVPHLYPKKGVPI